MKATFASAKNSRYEPATAKPASTDRMYFNEKGEILPIEITTKGVPAQLLR
jgi:hypothetical protein